ncbi:GNAT family N-acetyltransferase [Bacillus sp. B1-b2]|uniref:GNAT family N-acetyltransferase n=1 Tax=Bacillus sp. B1-b2 TaxID=2653201 RepID=UPI00126248BC|nr:GNAT family N-acetyltransferase [Bacillus sp. B1-b2]KAB7664690.1 GNAT family N-acetyltransferase [Bacillus sp. B1-b2]
MNIRKATLSDVKGVAKVQVDSWRSTYKGIVPDDYLTSLSYEKREELWQKVIPNGSVFVAENERGEIVGFANGGVERSGKYRGYEGELYAIYLLEDYQGQGIGKLLVNKVVEYLKEIGYNTMIIAALEENPACQFYEKIGGEIIGKEEVDIGGKRLIEVIYGWSAF